jgi:flavin reductase (DIM6/NTAB) family NADH-FMN oxidoreductase RutF
MHFDLEDYPLNARYKLMTGAIVPRPIAWVSTVSESGQPNLAPFSYFMPVCETPFLLAFCPGIRVLTMREKDTLRNIRATGEFVINTVSEEVAEAMNITATELPPAVNEFERADLTPVPSVRIAPPRVAESKISFECRIWQIVDVGPEAGSGSIVIGKAVHAHVADEVFYGGDKVDFDKLRPVGRLAGTLFCRVSDRFELIRPPAEIERESMGRDEMWASSSSRKN